MIRKEIVCYDSDASQLVGKTEKVVFPKNTKEVSEIIRVTNMDIVPRGAGTGLCGGCVPNSSLVMDMSKMNKIVSFNAAKKIIVVEAGITLKELNERLFAKGYEFPIDTLNKGVSSIGGMIATNASGKRAMKYGSIRDWLDEIEFVNGKGEIIKTSKADLTDACGMEGITGIITSAKLRVISKVKRSYSIFQADKLEDVIHVGRRLKSEKDVCSLILLSKSASKMLGFIDKYYLIVEFDSLRGKMQGKEYFTLLKKIENLHYTLGKNDYVKSEDPKLFFDKIQEFLEILDLEMLPYFAYLGNGIIHPFFKVSEKDKREKIVSYIKRTQAKFGKYGYGLLRKDFLDSFESKLIQRVKQRHDPLGKLNKSKLIDFFGYVKKQENKEERRNISTDSFKEDRLSLKPNIGEEITAKSIILNDKTPEEKINEFIKEVENMEEESIISDDKPSFEVSEDQKKLFEKKEVETYVKELPKEIIKLTSLPLSNRLASDFKQIKEDVEKKPEEKNFKKPSTSQEERDLINKIMGNRFGNINKGDNNNEHRS